MTAGKYQAQAVVLDFIAVRRHAFVGNAFRDLVIERCEAHAAPYRINRFETLCRHQPGARIGRHTLNRPLLERRAKCFVQRFFGDIEVAEQADQRGENTARFSTINRVDLRLQRVRVCLCSAHEKGRHPMPRLCSI